MKIERSYEGKAFRVTVIVESLEAYGHAWLTHQQERIAKHLSATAFIHDEAIEEEFKTREVTT